MAEAVSAENRSASVVKKALDILRNELSREEYFTYLQAVTPKTGDATKELREKATGLSLKVILKEAKKLETG